MSGLLTGKQRCVQVLGPHHAHLELLAPPGMIDVQWASKLGRVLSTAWQVPSCTPGGKGWPQCLWLRGSSSHPWGSQPTPAPLCWTGLLTPTPPAPCSAQQALALTQPSAPRIQPPQAEALASDP